MLDKCCKGDSLTWCLSPIEHERSLHESCLSSSSPCRSSLFVRTDKIKKTNWTDEINTHSILFDRKATATLSISLLCSEINRMRSFIQRFLLRTYTPYRGI